MKRYVKTRTRKDVDGEPLQVAVIYELGKKPNRFSYICWIVK